MKTRPERVRGAAEKVGHCYLCFRRLRLLRTFLASFHRSCAAADVSLSLGPKISGVKSNGVKSNNNRTPYSKIDLAVGKLSVCSLKERMGNVNATL